MCNYETENAVQSVYAWQSERRRRKLWGWFFEKNKCYNFVSEPLKSNIANAKGRKRSLRMSIDDTFRLLRQGQSERNKYNQLAWILKAVKWIVAWNETVQTRNYPKVHHQCKGSVFNLYDCQHMLKPFINFDSRTDCNRRSLPIPPSKIEPIKIVPVKKIHNVKKIISSGINASNAFYNA